MVIKTQPFFIYSFLLTLIVGFTSELAFLGLYLVLYFLAFRRPLFMLLYFLLCGILNILNYEVLDLPSILLEPIFQMALATYYLGFYILNGVQNIDSKIIMTLCLFALYLFFHGIIFSTMPILSLLKAASFIFIGSSIFLVLSDLSATSRNHFLAIVFFSILILMITSWMGYFSDFGYEVNGTGFQGILNHPQAMGIFAGAVFMFSVYLLTLNNEKFANILILAVLASAIIFIFLSESRTGLLMAIMPFSLVTLYLISQLFTKKSNILLLIIIFLIIILGIYFFKEELIAYLIKGSRAHNFSDTVIHSRGPLFLIMWNNILSSPFVGIGFGVPSDTLFYNSDNITSVGGIVISHPTEKGIMYFAVLEEIGVFGFIIFLSLLFFLLIAQVAKNLYGAMLALSILASNITEATFFAFGGAGLMFFIFFVIGVTSLKKIN